MYVLSKMDFNFITIDKDTKVNNLRQDSIWKPITRSVHEMFQLQYLCFICVGFKFHNNLMKDKNFREDSNPRSP